MESSLKKMSKFMCNKDYYFLNDYQKNSVLIATELYDKRRKELLNLRKVLRKMGFPQSKWQGSSMVRGWGKSTDGFDLDMSFPTANYMSLSIYGNIDKEKLKEVISKEGYNVDERGDIQFKI